MGMWVRAGWQGRPFGCVCVGCVGCGWVGGRGGGASASWMCKGLTARQDMHATAAQASGGCCRAEQRCQLSASPPPPPPPRAPPPPPPPPPPSSVPCPAPPCSPCLAAPALTLLLPQARLAREQPPNVCAARRSAAQRRPQRGNGWHAGIFPCQQPAEHHGPLQQRRPQHQQPGAGAPRGRAPLPRRRAPGQGCWPAGTSPAGHPAAAASPPAKTARRRRWRRRRRGRAAGLRCSGATGRCLKRQCRCVYVTAACRVL